MKVIVVEDNPVYNDYVCNFLKKGGFDTMQAYRLSTAKKLLAKAEEDNTVLADLRLPMVRVSTCCVGCARKGSRSRSSS